MKGITERAADGISEKGFEFKQHERSGQCRGRAQTV